MVFSSREQIIEPCILQGFEYQIDPYIGCAHRCRYCYTQNRSEVAWESEVGVYRDFEERLLRELSCLDAQTIYIGMNTDPYQPVEKEWRHTRSALRLLSSRGFSACILTKSDLVLRDIDLLKEISDASVGVSIAFGDEATRRTFERNAGSNRERMQALERLRKEKIETYVLISPVMPYITPVAALIEEARPYADTIWVYPLEVNSKEEKNWLRIKETIDEKFPQIGDEFERAVFSSDNGYWNGIREELEAIRRRGDVNLEIHV